MLSQQYRQYISRKVTFLSVVAMLMVILIHSITILNVEVPQWIVFLQYLILRSFTYMAVPLFFAISGYWLVRGRFSYTRKIKTLLLPYLFWAVIGGLSALPLVCANNIIGHKPLLERTFLQDGTFFSSVDRLLGICRLGPVGDEPLWYVRNLLLLFLAGPLLKCLVGKWYGKAVMALLWMALSFGFARIPINIYLDSVGTGWFLFGMLVASMNLETRNEPTWLLCTSGAVWALSSLIKCANVSHLLSLSSRSDLLIPAGGIVFCWGIYDRVEWMQSCRLPKLLTETFWIYCIHILFGGYIMGVSLFVFGKGVTAINVIALYTPILMLSLSMASAAIVKKYCPVLFKLLTGGRG